MSSTPSSDAQSSPTPRAPRRPLDRPRAEQPWPIRISHWLNVPLLVVMAGSGLEILAAYPYLGPRGAAYRWYPLQGHAAPAWLRLGGWLAGARALHFAFAWFLVANGLVYVVYAAGSGEWRRRLFLPARDLRNALQTALYYARIRKTPPEQGFYNGLQRLGYTSAVVLAAVVVLSGLAIWKPTQLPVLAACFGGYDGARALHLLGLVALAGFVAGHLLMVLLHPKTFPPMLTGGEKRVRPTDIQ